MNTDIRAIFLDLGGTFRIVHKNKPYQDAAKQAIANLCGSPMEFEEFYRLIQARYDIYRDWVLRHRCEAPEEVLWTRWLAPEFDRGRIEKAAAELTYLYRRVKGERRVVEGGIQTVKELCQRGYTLGIISDLVGTREVDEWLDEDKLRPYFKAVQQSSVTLIRKPHPAIYYYALREAGVRAENSAYVGDNLARDILGAKVTGFGMTIAVDYPGMPPFAPTHETMPDTKITAFPQLLSIFPQCGRVDEAGFVRLNKEKQA